MSLEPYRDGATIWVPKFAESADRSTIGHGYVQLDTADPDYARWDRYLRRKGRVGRRPGARR